MVKTKKMYTGLREASRAPAVADAPHEAELADATIVGGGPAGGVLALLLARHGTRINLLPKPKAAWRFAISPFNKRDLFMAAGKI